MGALNRLFSKLCVSIITILLTALLSLQLPGEIDRVAVSPENMEYSVCMLSPHN